MIIAAQQRTADPDPAILLHRAVDLSKPRVQIVLTLHFDAHTVPCMASTSLTIRIDEEVKRAIEQAAQAEDRNVTDFLIRSAKERMSAQCSRCGRSGGGTSVPAGLTAAMDEFLKLVKSKPRRRAAILITTFEGGFPRAYNGYLDEREDHRGTVVLSLDDSRVSLPIPRGVITGWDWDQEAKHHDTLIRFGGHQNGNLLVLMYRHPR